MGTFITATLTLFLGTLLGFFLRAREFRREQRLRVYGEFVAAFLTAAHVGAGLLSLYVSFGDTLYGSNADKLRDLWPRWSEASQAFEEATARLRLIASQRARKTSEEMEDFITANVRAVPPFKRGESTAEWGDAAKVGPSKVDSEAVRLSREFADHASRDVTLWREH